MFGKVACYDFIAKGNCLLGETSMSTTQFRSVRNRLKGYADDVQEWKSEHDRAMQCMDFELLLQHGLSLYETVNWIDETWRSRMFAKNQAFDQEMADLVEDLYKWWLRPCDVLLEELRNLERDFSVEYAEQFRSACREVKGLLTPDDEFFSGGDLVTLRDKALDAHERGECEAVSE